jgi:hypothetical protein
MTKVRPVTQLQLDGFATLLKDAEEAGQNEKPLSMREIREREIAAHMVLKDKLEGEDIPSWAEKYQEFLNSNIPWKIAAYIAWSIMVKSRRWPGTQDELATQVLGLNSDRRITEWRRKYPYIDQMIASCQTAEMLVYIPGSIEASGIVASRDDYKSTAERRLLWEAVGIIDKNSKLTVEQPTGNVAKDLLRRLDKVSNAKIIELLGADALEMMEQAKDEMEEDSEPPSASPLSPKYPSEYLGEEIEENDAD